MSDLLALRRTLVQADKPEIWLRRADYYLLQLEEIKENFILPADHALIRPILEYYDGDLAGWLAFVRSVRDRMDPKLPSFKEVQGLYKVIQVRMIQRRTRALLDVAISVAVRKRLIDNSFEAKQRYAKRCVQDWKKRKDNMLNAVRKDSPTGRVSTSHREELLREFWAQVEAEVNSEEVPKA